MAFAAAWLGPAAPASAQTAAEQALANSRLLPLIDPCASGGSAGDIVVCGRHDSQDRYRLPQTGEGEPFAAGRRIPGEAPRASAEPLGFAPCGIFAGERRCSKREMLEYGYGGGRDPLTVAGKLITALTDPDSAAGPPPLPGKPR
ncbi:MAG TPA: hypothetical protein VE891_06780 [Allosphingosinicella sp.]|nr:hypothetical protein [Allosphingosinicella sp.]